MDETKEKKRLDAALQSNQLIERELDDELKGFIIHAVNGGRIPIEHAHSCYKACRVFLAWLVGKNKIALLRKIDDDK